MHADQRNYLEKSLAAENSLKYQNPEDHSEWLSCGFTFRTLAHYDKLFVVWEPSPVGPRILGNLRIMDIDADIRDGLAMAISTTVHGKYEDIMWVDHKPTRLFGLPIFAHIPYVLDVTYNPDCNHPDKYVLRVPLVLKTKSSPKFPKLGDIYVTQVGEFRATYPEFADLKV